MLWLHPINALSLPLQLRNVGGTSGSESAISARSPSICTLNAKRSLQRSEHCKEIFEYEKKWKIEKN